MRLFFLLSLLLLAQCGRKANHDIVLRNVAIVDIANERIVGGQTVVIDGGNIVHIGAEIAFDGRADQAIDGFGKYLIPGLIDAHVHIDHPDELGLYPVYGVTGVFALRGLLQHLAWRSEIAAGTRFGPRLFTAGDYMDGYPPYMQPMMSFDDVESARGLSASSRRPATTSSKSSLD